MEKDNRTAEGIEPGTVVHDVFDEGIRFLIMRGPAAFCAYVGVPKDHPLAGYDYDSIPVDVHGGLTFSRPGEVSESGKTTWPDGYWWYGWDYAHLGDKCYYSSGADLEGKDWTVEEIKQDSWSGIYDFKRLMKLAEKIKKN